MKKVKKYNLLQPYYLSFYAKELYQDVAQNWRGTGFAYLLLLLAITWIPSMYLFHRMIVSWITDIAPQIVEQMPTITIENGVVSIDKPSPHLIKDPNSERIIAILDTSGQYVSFDKTPALVLLTKNQLLTRNYKNEQNVTDLKNVKFLKLTKLKTYTFLDYMKTWMAIFMYPICVLASFVYRMLWACIYAAIGAFIFARVLQVTLRYKQILRLCVIAMTPAIILSTILEAAGLGLAYQNIIFPFLTLITLGYVYFGIHANKIKRAFG